MRIAVIYTTHSSAESASACCDQLLQERLIACANIFPIQSAYWWQGDIQREGEYAAVLKTSPRLWEALKVRIEAIHPYETPCIVKIEAEANAAYAQWIESQVTFPA